MAYLFAHVREKITEDDEQMFISIGKDRCKR